MTAPLRCVACAATLSTLVVLGCTRQKHDGKPAAKHDATPADTTIHVHPGGPGNTPTSVTPTGTVPRHFWINYDFDPPGRRDWVNVGKGKWEERWANGTVVKYVEDGPYDIGGYNGMMVHPEAGGDYILLPYGGVGAMVRTRPTPNARNWSNLAEIAGIVEK